MSATPASSENQPPDGGPLPPSRRREQPGINERPTTMLAIIALALVAILALAILTVTVHLLFSPWLLVAAVAAVAWVKFRPRHSRR